jgi:hypothetical protein
VAFVLAGVKGRIMSEKIRVLVVWNEIPDRVTFVIFTMDAREKEKLLSFHGKFVNDGTSTMELQKELYAYFYDESGTFRFQRRLKALLSQEFDLIIQTGFIL